MLKAAAVLGLAALFGVSAAVRERRAHPPLQRLLSTPERWDGAEIRLPSTRVRSGSEVDVDGLRLAVRGELGAPGEVVDVRGVFRAGARRLDLIDVRRRPARWPLLLVLAWAIWNFRRHFRASRPEFE